MDIFDLFKGNQKLALGSMNIVLKQSFSSLLNFLNSRIYS